MPETDIDRDEQILYGAHIDYQGYTILRPDPCDWKLEEARGLHPIISATSGNKQLDASEDP
jgi:hypothetical protein